MVVGVVMWCPGACIGPGLMVRWGGFQGSGAGRERETAGGACVGAHWWLRVVCSHRELVSGGNVHNMENVDTAQRALHK